MVPEADVSRNVSYKVLDPDGDLLGEFPASRHARSFAEGMIRDGRASTLDIVWLNGMRQGRSVLNRRGIQAAERKRQQAEQRRKREARRRANTISGIVVLAIVMFTVLNVVAACGGAYTVPPGFR